jgi:long-chain acyl-CoA synthetase
VAIRLARALGARGLKSGDALALLCGNRPEFVEVINATQRAGFRLTPINWHLTGEEAGYIVSDCEAKAIITDDVRGEVATKARAASPACRIGLAIGKQVDGFESYADALAAEGGEPLSDRSPGNTMLYTSGTTGRPKGVHRPAPELGAESRGRVAANATTDAARAAAYNPEGGDRHLLTGPLYHAAPLAFSLRTPLAYGATVVMMERWDAEEALRLIGEHRITHTHMVPTMFHRLLALPDEVRARHDVSSLRYVVHGAAPCPVPVKRKLIEWLGPIVFEYYAATEGGGSSVDSKTWLEHPGTVGKPLREDQVIIGTEDGEPLPAGEVGLVYMKAQGETRFSYYKDEDKTANAFRGDYFTLGDVGYLDEEGYLYLTDRSANLIISGGVNIYPAEVDAVLLEHEAVGDAATIGVPDEEWGESVLAVVELRDGVAPTRKLADELIAFCRDRLAHYKCPRRVEFIDVLPRQDNGKIYKRLLRDQFRATSS